MKKMLIFLFILICAIFGGYILNDVLSGQTKFETADNSGDSENSEVYTPNYKILSAETLLKNISRENKIITSSINLSCEIKIDESWLDWSAFKKTQRIKFYGSAIYTIDLESLTTQDIFIGEDFIKIYLNKPALYALNLNVEKTVAEKIERGFLRFGDIKITPENFKTMQNQALDNMHLQLDNEEVTALYKENAEVSAINFFKNVLIAIKSAEQMKANEDNEINEFNGSENESGESYANLDLSVEIVFK